MDVHRRYLIGLLGVAGALIALLLLPFAGFTEKTTYWLSFAITGLGTWGEGMNPFEYPETLFYVSMLMLVGAVALIGPLRMLWIAYRGGREPTGEQLGRGVRTLGALAVGLVILMLLTMFVLLPSVEDQTIWFVEANGFLSDWWPGYGAFVAFGGTVVGFIVLRRLMESRPPPPPPP